MIKNILAAVSIGLASYGTMIHDDDINDNVTSIVCHVIESDGVYVACQNFMDDDDIIWIDKDYGTMGNVLHVTFKDDDVWMVDKIDNH